MCILYMQSVGDRSTKDSSNGRNRVVMQQSWNKTVEIEKTVTTTERTNAQQSEKLMD